MKKLLGFVLGITLLAGCGSPPPAPEASPAAGAGVPMQAPPVFALIGARERLNLTSEQITALDSIGTWNSSANETVLRELRMRAPRDRRLSDPAVDSMVMIVRENNLQAARTVQSLLSEEQRTEVCELFRAPEPRRSRSQRGAPGELGTRRYVWPWCVTAEEQPGTQDTAPETAPGTSSPDTAPGAASDPVPAAPPSPVAESDHGR